MRRPLQGKRDRRGGQTLTLHRAQEAPLEHQDGSLGGACSVAAAVARSLLEKQGTELLAARTAEQGAEAGGNQHEQVQGEWDSQWTEGTGAMSLAQGSAVLPAESPGRSPGRAIPSHSAEPELKAWLPSTIFL